ncbi:MFS transporter [Kineosporia sp. J2-2]|uniref:MFS transporter n=1 Tax=Kineosporia corallincola TaxID=2835133 RepID=A0ABS5TS42_9ACTN|nr:MFS transporter [Kineosporia corallincola]MBT0773601.1 MFS transporter [Kineosporia corallincola]
MRRPATTVTFWLVFGASTLENATFNGTSPVIARFVTGSFGASPAAAGVIAALAPLSSLVWQPIAGHAADRYGYRLVGVAGAVAALAGFLLTLLTTVGPQTLALAGLGRILIGGGGASVATVATAWVVATSPRASRGQALSIFGLSVWIAFALGPVIGENVYQTSGFAAVWLVFAAMTAAMLFCVAFAVEPVRPEPAGAMTLSGLREVVSTVSRPGVVAAAAWAGQAVITTYLVVLLESRGLATDGWFGAASLFPVFAVCLIASRVLFSRLTDTTPPRPIAIGGLLGITAGLLILSATSSFWTAALGAALLGFVYAPMYPALTLLASDGLPADHRAVGLGVFSSFTALGMAAGQFMGGFVDEWLGLGWVFVVTAALQLLALPALPPSARTAPPAP